ncbi:DUF962 domain-containing protein [Shewanella cyperi]|uniref:DUF962 domain-containing protein n=1 Tax=Shewanella cyperi TaxID=2814292 RepID=A0A974XMC8_9GAMM|nr:DUF962 domain-containing protein [Shewanella cyperi]QSX31060.1 DUF962 domain-containing protein [Shewanella cyperi]QSX41843.1 DUF962 domain-containing protein [Shewanella cyperi]
MSKPYTSFAEFYPFYLSQHQHPWCRAAHYIGSCLVILILGYCLVSQNWRLLWTLPVVGYGFAWIGHALFEKNKPATFDYPWYSFVADWVMLFDFLGRLRK